MDCLRYWVVEMHVDGFRFDLGSVLGRDSEGRIMENPPILERIAEEPGPAGHQDHRGGLGRGGRLPGGIVPRRQVGGVERPVPRRRAPVLARGRGDGFRARHPPGRKLRSVPARRPKAVPQHQLRDLSRRVHPERPGELRAQAQRGKRRRKPRRLGQQRQRQLRGGRPDEQSGGGVGQEPPGEELPGHAAALPGHPDAPGRGRDAPHAAREQQPLVPEQRDLLVRLAAGRNARGHPCVLQGPDRLPHAASRLPAAGVLQREELPPQPHPGHHSG